MTLLLDTNVVSELRKVNPGRADPGVVAWLALADHDAMFISVFTLFELEYGVRLLERKDPVQSALLHKWVTLGVMPAFSGQILPVDEPVAQHAARLRAETPRQIPGSFIAATAHVHKMTVVTRNVRDFESMGVRVLNPWAS